MPIRINTHAVCLLAFALMAAGGALADTEDPRAASERRWTPSLSITGGVTIQNQDATSESRCATGGPAQTDFPHPTQPGRLIDLPACSLAPFIGPGNLRPPKASSEDVASPFVSSAFQLMTPTFEFLPFRPRIFASGEFITFYSAERKIAREGRPSGAVSPPTLPNPADYPAIALGGVGSQTASKVQLYSYGAKLGIAFPFELMGRRLWIKPAAGWMQYEVDVEGFVVAGIKDDYQNVLPKQWGRNLREIRLLGSGSATLHGIGPGAELEMEAGRFGPLGVNIFLEGHAYKIAPKLFGHRLGDRREVRFSDQVLKPLEIDPGPPQRIAFFSDTYDATWSWEADPWVWRTGVGVRVHWLGQ